MSSENKNEQPEKTSLEVAEVSKPVVPEVLFSGHHSTGNYEYTPPSCVKVAKTGNVPDAAGYYRHTTYRASVELIAGVLAPPPSVPSSSTVMVGNSVPHWVAPTAANYQGNLTKTSYFAMLDGDAEEKEPSSPRPKRARASEDRSASPERQQLDVKDVPMLGNPVTNPVQLPVAPPVLRDIGAFSLTDPAMTGYGRSRREWRDLNGRLQSVDFIFTPNFAKKAIKAATQRDSNFLTNDVCSFGVFPCTIDVSTTPFKGATLSLYIGTTALSTAFGFKQQAITDEIGHHYTLHVGNEFSETNMQYVAALMIELGKSRPILFRGLDIYVQVFGFPKNLGASAGCVHDTSFTLAFAMAFCGTGAVPSTGVTDPHSPLFTVGAVGHPQHKMDLCAKQLPFLFPQTQDSSVVSTMMEFNEYACPVSSLLAALTMVASLTAPMTQAIEEKTKANNFVLDEQNNKYVKFMSVQNHVKELTFLRSLLANPNTPHREKLLQREKISYGKWKSLTSIDVKAKPAKNTFEERVAAILKPSDSKKEKKLSKELVEAMADAKTRFGLEPRPASFMSEIGSSFANDLKLMNERWGQLLPPNKFVLNNDRKQVYARGYADAPAGQAGAIGDAKGYTDVSMLRLNIKGTKRPTPNVQENRFQFLKAYNVPTTINYVVVSQAKDKGRDVIRYQFVVVPPVPQAEVIMPAQATTKKQKLTAGRAQEPLGATLAVPDPSASYAQWRGSLL